MDAATVLLELVVRHLIVLLPRREGLAPAWRDEKSTQTSPYSFLGMPTTTKTRGKHESTVPEKTEKSTPNALSSHLEHADGAQLEVNSSEEALLPRRSPYKMVGTPLNPTRD